MQILSCLVVVAATLISVQAEKKPIDVTHKSIFDVSQGGKPLGQITIGLFGKLVPRTVQNFATFSSAQGYQGLSYAGSKFHRVIPNFMIQGGDMVNGDGTGSVSIYGGKFEDEGFALKHTEPGMLSMANSGKDTNGCQFFLTTVATPWLDGKHVIFGKVISGMNIVKQIEATRRDSGDKPLEDIIITKTQVVPVRGIFNIEQ
ncbi:Peptidyl-prolyl cis-trans isomerase 6 [Halotydeus destructor]|nr:Peptidyl-prolyl cis-trans isomerase 6 [Halotydeus destructor]